MSDHVHDHDQPPPGPVTVRVYIPGDTFVTMAVGGALTGYRVEPDGSLTTVADVQPLAPGERCEQHPHAPVVDMVPVPVDVSSRGPS
jgi:hypothetical protein